MVMEIGAVCFGGVFGALLGRHTAKSAESVLKTSSAALAGLVLTAGLSVLSGQANDAIWWYPIGLAAGAIVGFVSAVLLPLTKADAGKSGE